MREPQMRSESQKTEMTRVTHNDTRDAQMRNQSQQMMINWGKRRGLSPHRSCPGKTAEYPKWSPFGSALPKGVKPGWGIWCEALSAIGPKATKSRPKGRQCKNGQKMINRFSGFNGSSCPSLLARPSASQVGLRWVLSTLLLHKPLYRLYVTSLRILPP